jgi:excisionase family DNA binding protein
MKNEFNQDDQHITKKEMAARMQVTTRTIDAWMSRGFVPFRKIGRTVRFDWGEVREHLKLRSRPAVVPVVRKPGDGIAAMLRERAKAIRSAESGRGNISSADRSA